MQPGYAAHSKRVRYSAVPLTISQNLENTSRNIRAETGLLPRYGDLFISAFLHSGVACR